MPVHHPVHTAFGSIPMRVSEISPQTLIEAIRGRHVAHLVDVQHNAADE
jgi:hypothetical protein